MQNQAPGLTKRMERILAYRLITRTIIEKGSGQVVETKIVNDFVIEMLEEPNLIIIIDAVRVGLKEVKAYLALVDNERYSVTNNVNRYSLADRERLRRIKGVARKELNSFSRFRPQTVILIKYDGENRVMNQSALQKIKTT